MNTDRSIVPEIHPLLPELHGEELPSPFNRLVTKSITLPNEATVCLVDDTSTELVRLEVTVNAGIIHQAQPLQAQTCALMLKEGSKNRNENEMAEIFDYHGAYTSAGALPDFSVISIVVLKRYFDQVLPAFAEMVCNPLFPEKAFRRITEERRQEFIINREKLPWEARRHMMNQLFGEQHPYGRLTVEHDFGRLTPAMLHDFHRVNYWQKGFRLMLTGNFDEPIINKVSETFGNIIPNGHKNTVSPPPVPFTERGRQLRVEKKDSLQTAIRIGRIVPGMDHPDFIPLQIATNCLGGFFGSRLNMNLREEKGYTYGIGAGLIPMKSGSVFTIGAEIEASVTDSAIADIMKEIENMATRPPEGDELKQALTYLAGSFIRSVDGAFALADRIRGVTDFGLDHRFYAQYLKSLQTITPETIAKVSRMYLNPDKMIVVRVGK